MYDTTGHELQSLNFEVNYDASPAALAIE